MPAPKGNKNAETWTREAVIEQLAKIEAEAKKPSCLWLGSALVKVGLYRELWSYWSEKFKGDDVVFQTIKRIDQYFEDRLFAKAAKGDLNATIAIFGLKNNHGWTDKKDVDVTTKGESINERKIKPEDLTDEELKTLIAIKKKSASNEEDQSK